MALQGLAGDNNCAPLVVGLAARCCTGCQPSPSPLTLLQVQPLSGTESKNYAVKNVGAVLKEFATVHRSASCMHAFFDGNL